MSGPAATIVLITGGITFTGEWYWNKNLDWKVPLATVLLAAGAEGLSAIDKNGATIFATIAFFTAVTTKYDGHSAVDMITNMISGGKTPTASKKSTALPSNPNPAPNPGQPGGQLEPTYVPPQTKDQGPG